jgi:hypothetical protein
MLREGSHGVLRRRMAQTSSWVILCLFALAAWAQSIKIPDLRQMMAPPVYTLKPGERCNECGRVLSVREVPSERQVVQAPFPASPGTSAGQGEHLVGAVVYLPLSDRASDRPYVGGVGTPEMRERMRANSYEIAVKLDDGKYRLAQRADGSHFRPGDRVRFTETNELELVTD